MNLTPSEWYTLVTTVCTVLYLIWFYLWLFVPFKCSCGKLIWTRRGMKKHLATPHKWN